MVSTHSHPKVAASAVNSDDVSSGVSTHSHPKVAAVRAAAMRAYQDKVSTHSHPKVAAVKVSIDYDALYGFNTQPPEGGCVASEQVLKAVREFQHTATRRWLPIH